MTRRTTSELRNHPVPASANHAGQRRGGRRCRDHAALARGRGRCRCGGIPAHYVDLGEHAPGCPAHPHPQQGDDRSRPTPARIEAASTTGRSGSTAPRFRDRRRTSELRLAGPPVLSARAERSAPAHTDLIVLDTDPLSDITALAKPSHLVVRGGEIIGRQPRGRHRDCQPTNDPQVASSLRQRWCGWQSHFGFTALRSVRGRRGSCPAAKRSWCRCDRPDRS